MKLVMQYKKLLEKINKALYHMFEIKQTYKRPVDMLYNLYKELDNVK